MIDRLRRHQQRAEAGFTLIELLVVITILGILAGVVVFAVGGVGDKGQKAACQTDTVTIRTAEEAYFAKNGQYVALTAGAGAPLVPLFLSNNSLWHTVATTGGGTGYTISEGAAIAPATTNPCGTVGGLVTDGSNGNY